MWASNRVVYAYLAAEDHQTISTEFWAPQIHTQTDINKGNPRPPLPSLCKTTIEDQSTSQVYKCC